jgi:hypothetical protein
MVRDNLGIGRPDQAELIFTGRRTPRGRPRTKPETFKTKIVTRGAQVTVNAFKHSRIKHYLKDGRALRIETVVNCANDLGAQRRLHNLPKLQRKARQVNHRMLYAQRTGPGCAITDRRLRADPTALRKAGPTNRSLALADPRAMALAGALCLTLHAVTGPTNRSLRALIAGLLGTPLQRQPDKL